MILYYMAEVEKSSDGEDGTLENKARLYDKLGDLCCGLKAYSSAVKFYGKQVRHSTYFLWGKLSIVKCEA